jgi:ribosomal protein L7/L12
MPEILRLVAAGNKVGAIKAYRDATGAGLREAKEAVEQLGRGVH